MVETVIVNVVATATLNQKVDLNELGKLDYFTNNPNIYGGRVAYFKTSNMKGKVSIFGSGKMISIGTASEEEAFDELEYTKKFLVKKGLTKPIPLQPRIHNIVVKADFGQYIDLEELSKKSKMIYEPEQFPGGILSIVEPYKATALVFSSGKAVITGVNNSKQVKPTTQKIMDIIKNAGIYSYTQHS